MEKFLVKSFLLLVRVGGGFLSLEEFLRINVPIELEKMAQRDPIKVLSQNIAVNKVIAGRGVGNSEISKITPLTYKNALEFSARFEEEDRK